MTAALAARVAARSRCGLGGAIALQRGRDAALAADRQVGATELLYVRSPAVVTRAGARVTTALAADIYWIRAIQHFGGERLDADGRTGARLRAALSAARSDDDARSVLQHRLPLRRHLPRRAVSGRPGPARPGGRAAAKGDRRAADRSGSTCRTSASSTTGTCATTRRPRDWFQRAAAAARRADWLQPLAASTLAEGGHRATARVMWQQLAKPNEPWLRQHRRAQPARSSTRSTQIDALQARSRRPRRASGGAARDLGGAVRRGCSAACRSIRRHAVRLDPATGAITRSPTSPLFPLPDAARRRDEPPTRCAPRPRRLLGPRRVGSFLNVCIHRAAAAAVGRAARVALPALRLRAALVRQHSARELCAARAAAAARCRAPHLAPLSDRRSSSPVAVFVLAHGASSARRRCCCRGCCSRAR